MVDTLKIDIIMYNNEYAMNVAKMCNKSTDQCKEETCNGLGQVI